MARVKYDIVFNFGKEMLIAYGAREKDADVVLKHLLNNHLMGVPSQGLMRVMEYSKFLADGFMNGNAKPVITSKAENIFKVDGDKGFGIVAMEMASHAMSDALKLHPFAMAAVTNVGHTGRLGAYSEFLTNNNHAYSAVFGGGGHKRYQSVAPFGGRKGVFSTNPISMAMPGKDGVAVSADFATSSTAGGKIRFARDAGLQLPPNQILDKNGLPTTNPNDYFAGGVILPSAGAKGTGLGLICEMLCYAMLGEALEFNWFLLAFDIDVFADEKSYDERAKEFFNLFEACPPALGFNRVYYPGQMEAIQKDINTLEGIEVDEGTRKTLVAFADKKKLKVPEMLKPTK